MKISLKLQDNHQKHQTERHHQPPPPPPPLLLRAKIPITIFNLPFLSHFSTTTTHPSDLSLALSTNFASFPSLKLSYATAASPAAAPPVTLTLKSGTGLFGSPKNSPLVISAHFSFDPSNPAHPNPTFSLFLKPQLGSFSLRKSTFSHPEPSISAESVNPDAVCDSNSFAFVPLETPAPGKELPPQKNVRASIFRGIQLAAATQMPLAKRIALNFRWRVNLEEDQMPILRINKIGIHRVDDAVRKDEKIEKNEQKLGELEVMKSMCFWMQREVDALTRANLEMKSEFEEMRRRSSRDGGVGGGNVKEGVRRSGYGGGSVKEGTRKKSVAMAAPMKQWKGEENGKKEEKKNGNVAIDVESELQRAIMAASAAASST